MTVLGEFSPLLFLFYAIWLRRVITSGVVTLINFFFRSLFVNLIIRAQGQTDVVNIPKLLGKTQLRVLNDLRKILNTHVKNPPEKARFVFDNFSSDTQQIIKLKKIKKSSKFEKMKKN